MTCLWLAHELFATAAVQDAGFKVIAHMMPDLPNVGLERDMDRLGS